jgi:hypothetical protein
LGYFIIHYNYYFWVMKQNQPVNPHLYHYSLLGYRFSQTVPKVFSYSYRFILSQRPYFCLFYWYTFRYILSANDNRNKSFWKTQEKQWRNQGIKWKYDIVAKATSDTIWDWKIQEEDLLEQRIKHFRIRKHQVGDSSKWWFDNIHPKTASKCLLNYILL